MAKTTSNKFIDTVDECLSNGVKNGIFQVSVDDYSLNGRLVTIDSKLVVNFGSCSYLGLEVDERLKQGAIDATNRFGTQYSASRAFSACSLYEELEDLLSKIFDDNPAILAATTTLTHVAAVPILVQDDDLVILDHQVHGSVQLAAQLVKAKGTRVEMIRHNRMDMLEDFIKVNPNRYNKIWYMVDGLYSMYGDYAPLRNLVFLMEKYHNFHLYIDDAHGMSWTGKHGGGYVLSQMKLHPKMVLTTSLAKGFGTGGGVLILSDKEMMRKILTCGSSYTFSGPVQPPMLGASIASAKIHLSDEIYELQSKLEAKIELTRSLIEQYSLPVVLSSNSPIFYLGLGLPRVGYNMVKRLLHEGFYANIGIFPAVPVKCTGLRLPITNGQTDDDIRNVLDAFQYHFPRVLEEEGITVDGLSKSFNLPFDEVRKRYSVAAKNTVVNFNIQHETTIHSIDKALWNELLGDNGTYDWEGCRFLEETFCDNPDIENNWKFHYLIIRDENTKPILATFFTELLCKDDLIAPANTSRQIEVLRKNDKYYLSSKMIMMGSLLTVGDHLFLDRKHPKWRDALVEMLNYMNAAKQQYGAEVIILRDIDSNDGELGDFLLKEGFIKVDMPQVCIIESLKWDTIDSFIKTLSVNNRRNLKKTVLLTLNDFEITLRKKVGEVNLQIREEEIDHWYELYRNVKEKGFSINTFDVPKKLYKIISQKHDWEIIELRLKSSPKPVAVVFCHLSISGNYSPIAIGLDYQFVYSHGSYRQGIFQSILRARSLECKKVFLGMTASEEKHKFGAVEISKSAFLQTNENFNMELIGTIYSGKPHVYEQTRV